MENITELVRCRRSVRTFDGKEVNDDDRKKLALFMEKIENPLGGCCNRNSPNIMQTKFTKQHKKRSGAKKAHKKASPSKKESK